MVRVTAVLTVYESYATSERNQQQQHKLLASHDEINR